MVRFVVQLILSVGIILLATWTARRMPAAAGFVTALPMTTMLVLIFARADGASAAEQSRFARSLLLALPLSASFLLPFAFGARWLPVFAVRFGLGLGLLACSFLLHRALLGDR